MHCVRPIRSLTPGIVTAAKPSCRRSIMTTTTNFPYTKSVALTWKLHEKNEYPESDITWEEARARKKILSKERLAAQQKMPREERTTLTAKRIAFELGTHKHEDEVPKLPPVEQARLDARYTAGAIALVLSHVDNIRLLGHKLLPLIPTLPPPARHFHHIRRTRKDRRSRPIDASSSSSSTVDRTAAQFPQVNASSHSCEDVYADPVFREHLMEVRDGHVWQPIFKRPSPASRLGVPPQTIRAFQSSRGSQSLVDAIDTSGSPQAACAERRISDSAPLKPPDNNPPPPKKKSRLYASAPVINPLR